MRQSSLLILIVLLRTANILEFQVNFFLLEDQKIDIFVLKCVNLKHYTRIWGNNIRRFALNATAVKALKALTDTDLSDEGAFSWDSAPIGFWLRGASISNWCLSNVLDTPGGHSWRGWSHIWLAVGRILPISGYTAHIDFTRVFKESCHRANITQGD